MGSHPVFAAFVRALERHAGRGTAALMRAPFAGPGREELRRLLTETGFDKVQVRIATFPARFPSPGEFLRRQATSSPLGASLTALDVLGVGSMALVAAAVTAVWRAVRR